MTEDVTIENGRLKVARAEHKEDVDIDLSNVETVHYERSVLQGADGALVIRERGDMLDNQTVIRVDSEDAEEIYTKVLDAIPAKMELGEEPATPQQSNTDSDVSADAPRRARNSEAKAARSKGTDQGSDQA